MYQSKGNRQLSLASLHEYTAAVVLNHCLKTFFTQKAVLVAFICKIFLISSGLLFFVYYATVKKLV